MNTTRHRAAVLVAGEALIDLLITPAGTVTAALGGGPFNAARTIGRLGVACTFIGGLSVDRFGSQLAAALVADGVAIGVAGRCQNPTTLAAAELDAGGAASYRFYIDGTSAPLLEPGQLPAEVDGAGVAALHVGSLALALDPIGSTLLTLATDLRGDALIMVDLNCRPLAVADHDEYRRRLLAFAAVADVVKASTEDLEFLVPHAEPTVSAAQLAREGAVVLLTDGARPVRVITATEVRTVAVPSVDVVDTVGAGDSFGAGFLAWWVDGGRGVADLSDLDALEHAVRIGASVSAITCGRTGADPPTRTELADW